MRYVNAFKPIRQNKRIEYSDRLLAAVLDPRIQIALNVNGGFDYVDCKFRFIKLLLERGQIVAIRSGSDLLARTDYIEATLNGRTFVNVVLETQVGPSFASERRMHAARMRLLETRQQRGA
jgi:hypothetical protein